MESISRRVLLEEEYITCDEDRFNEMSARTRWIFLHGVPVVEASKTNTLKLKQPVDIGSWTKAKALCSYRSGVTQGLPAENV